ncbi:unnamed protein product, partial [Vitis vinifera]
MGLFKSLSISSFLLITLFFTSAHAAIFNIQNRSYGAPPNTLAEFALNQFNNLDFFDISLVDGFNVPMAFNPTSNGYFKTRCPDAYSYPKDDQTSTFTCPGGTNYDVIFCP